LNDRTLTRLVEFHLVDDGPRCGITRRQPVEVKIFPGGHFYVNSSRPAVLETVVAALRAATRR